MEAARHQLDLIDRQIMRRMSGCYSAARPPLAAEEEQAPQAYAAEHGRRWKSVLNHLWMGGPHMTMVDRCAVCAIRTVRPGCSPIEAASQGTTGFRASAARAANRSCRSAPADELGAQDQPLDRVMPAFDLLRIVGNRIDLSHALGVCQNREPCI